jgi:hypothetical protein
MGGMGLSLGEGIIIKTDKQNSISGIKLTLIHNFVFNKNKLLFPSLLTDLPRPNSLLFNRFEGIAFNHLNVLR